MSTPETTIPDGGPAFPAGPFGDTMHGEDGRTWHQFPATSGMSLRAWFAGQALVGMLAGSPTDTTWPDPKVTAYHCTDYADALLERLRTP